MASEDARFEDGGEAPLFLSATDAEGLSVLTALTQDAVFPITEMRWQARARRFAVLLNRFRWEDKTAAERRSRPYERVQSLLVIDGALRVQTQGIDRGESETVLSLMSLGWSGSDAPEDDPSGRLTFTLAGDGAIAVEAECLDVTLKDVTRPYLAPSGKAPSHD